jgi:hypothetical protein
MAKILDPDDLAQGVSIIFTVTGSPKTIEIVPKAVNASSNIVDTGSSATNGVTFQCLYSFAKEEWRTDSELIKYPFPLVSITEESFELVNDWDFQTGQTVELVRDGGWSLKDSGGTSVEEYANITSLGSFDAQTDLAYYLQVTGFTTQPTDMVFSGEVNQAVKIYGDANNGNINYRDVFKLYLREEAKTYGFYDLLTEQNLSLLTFKKFALPLSNNPDLNIGVADSAIDSNSDGTADTPTYSGMSISYYDNAQQRDIGGTNYDFHVIIDGANQPKQQIYEFVQWSLRQIVDIDANSGTTIGKVAEELLEFVGDTLKTKLTSIGGVFIDNYQVSDINDLVFVDDTGTERTFPFVAAGNLQFNDNLTNDSVAVYRVFFTNDDAGDDAGNDFGTAGAITIQDNSGPADIAGGVSAHTGGLIAFDYDYDNNVQRGNASSGTDAPYTAVAIGLSTAQYVVTTGTIVRSTSNVINYVAALERNYLNP